MVRSQARPAKQHHRGLSTWQGLACKAVRRWGTYEAQVHSPQTMQVLRIPS